MRWFVVVACACSAGPTPLANRAADPPPVAEPEPATCVDRYAVAAAADDDRVRGDLDRNGIKHVIHAHQRELQACYERYLQHDSGAGRVDVTFTIARGQVTRAEVTGFDPELDRCVCLVVARCEFPKFRGSVVVTYPFDFHPVSP